MDTQGFDLRERPWQPGLDDTRFNQQPRNPNFTGGPSPEATAYQRANDLRGMSATERPFTQVDARTFGTAPTASAAPTTSRAGVMNSLRTGYAGIVGNGTHFGPTRPVGKLALAGRAAGGLAAAYPEVMNVSRVAADDNSTGVDVATQAAEGVGRGAATYAGAAMGAKAGAALGSLAGPIGTGVGAVAGGLIGGWGGHKAADSGIRNLREAVGVSPESPVDRTAEGAVSLPQLGSADVTDAPTTQPIAQPTGQPQGQPQGQAAPTNDITKTIGPDGRVSYSGSNIGEGATINGQQPGGRSGGISPQNMAAADALAQRDALRSMGAVASQQQAPMPPGIASPRPLTSHELRNLRVSANSIMNTEKWGGKGASNNPDVQIYKNAMDAYIAQRGGMDPGTISRTRAQADMYGSQASADASRYSSDNSLRGDMFKTAATERSTRAAAAAAARKQESDDVIRQNDLDVKNTDRTRERFSVYGADGKRDEAATNQAILAMDKITPGFSRMSEDARGKALPHADALFNIYNRTRSGREMGLGQAVFGSTNPPNDSLPNFKGGKLLRQGLAGALPGQAGKDGYYVRMPDGREVQLGAGLSENELKLIRRNIEAGGWKD